jgi:hypothetical protein
MIKSTGNEAGASAKIRSSRAGVARVAALRLVQLLTLWTATCAFGATYYATQSGAGSQNGSSLANAWSVATFNSSTLPTGGDTVIFSGTFTSTVDPASGGTGNGASRLTLDFSGATLTTADPRINLGGAAYLNVKGGSFGSPLNENAIFSFNFATAPVAHDITIQNWTGTGQDQCVTAFISIDYCYNLTVTNNNVQSMGGFIWGDSTLNHDLTVINNVAVTGHTTGTQADIIRIGDIYNVLIQGNKLVQQAPGATSGNHNDIIQTYIKGGGNAGNPYGWVVRYNWIELNVTSGSGDTSFMMMENMGENGSTDGLKVYGNVFKGDPTDTGSNNGVCADSNNSTAVFRFYNNTVIRENGPDNTIRFLSPGILYAENNIGYAPSAPNGTTLSWGMTVGAPWDYNWYFNWGASSTYTGAHGGTSDPRFKNYANDDFSLTTGSPCIGTGDSTIGSEYSQGIAPGATWPNPTLVTRSSSSWDLGAYVYGAGLPSTNPAINLSQTSLNFGSIETNTTTNLTFTVKNTGGGTLSGTATTSPPFSIVGGGSFNLASNASQTVTVRYSPTLVSSGDSGVVTLTAGGGGTSTVSLSGSSWPLLGLSFASTSGVLSGGYVVSNSFIYTTSTVTDPTAGGQAVYHVNVTNPGYYLITNNAIASNQGSKSYYINFDSASSEPANVCDLQPPVGISTNYLVSWRGTGSPTNDQYMPNYWYLTSGIHVLNISSREAYAFVGSITIAPSNSVAKALTPPLNLRVVSVN